MSRFRPCIDLHEGMVKQIVGGTLSDAGATTNFVSKHEPGWFARLYQRDGLAGGHVIKLGPGCDRAAEQALAAWPGGMQVGGGVTAENARKWLDAGASQVIVTSFIFSDGELKRENLKKIVDAAGRENLVLDLSCRRTPEGKYFIVTDRWQKFTRLELNRATLSMLADHAAEFLVHAVDVEGRRAGIDAELLAILAGGSPLPCVYAGGISSLEDIEFIEKHSDGRVDYTVGSALDIFGGNIKYESLVSRQPKKGL